jgi:dihydroneopterin aldolase
MLCPRAVNWSGAGKGFIVACFPSRRCFSVDIVFIKGLRVGTTIGVHAWEQRIRQTLLVDLELGADIRPAAQSDSLIDALDYTAVADRIQAFAGEQSFHLVETLAERLAGLLLEEFAVSWLRLRVDKAGARRDAAGVGVVIERGARG